MSCCGVTSVAADPTAAHVLSWDDITATAEAMAAKVLADGVPDVVVAVLRGGVIPAVLLAHQLGVRAVRAVEIIHTTTDGVNADKTAQPQVTNPDSLGHLAGADVLIVDDIAGTGDTADRAADLVCAAGAARIRTAVCVVNTGNWRRPQPPEQALTYVGATLKGWVSFPWELR
jgi:hypoxanthine phosphoribosyltransferase